MNPKFKATVSWGLCFLLCESVSWYVFSHRIYRAFRTCSKLHQPSYFANKIKYERGQPINYFTFEVWAEGGHTLEEINVFLKSDSLWTWLAPQVELMARTYMNQDISKFKDFLWPVAQKTTFWHKYNSFMGWHWTISFCNKHKSITHWVYSLWHFKVYRWL